MLDTFLPKHPMTLSTHPASVRLVSLTLVLIMFFRFLDCLPQCPLSLHVTCSMLSTSLA